MNRLKKEIENMVNLIRESDVVSEVFFDCSTSNEIKVHLEVVTAKGVKFPYKIPIKTSNNCEEVKAVFKDIYPEYFI